jgi:hypothetical protein
MSAPDNDQSFSESEKEEFAGIMIVDRMVGIITISAILTVSALYWFAFFSFAVKLESLVYSYFGVGQ